MIKLNFIVLLSFIDFNIKTLNRYIFENKNISNKTLSEAGRVDVLVTVYLDYTT